MAFETRSGHAEFTSSAPLHSFTGKSDHLNGLIDIDENIVDFYLDLETLKTGIDRRDRDMYKTLNVEEFPFAEFTGELTSSFDFDEDESQQAVVQGTFTVNGESREITVQGTLQKTDEGVKLQASWSLDLRDYDIEPPGILFYRVSNIQEVRIEATLKPQTES